MRILMVEDTKYMAEAVAQVLRKNNYSVDFAYDGEYGLDCALSGIYDIIILDIMMPKMDGLTVLSELRKSGVDTPVLLLTAKGETSDKVIGLDAGADDYLAKPYQAEELLARLRALGRRKTEFVNENILSFGDIELNPLTLILSCNKKNYKLTLKESQVMELLIKQKNTSLSKETIIEKLWGYDSDADDSHVEVYISFLRKKLKGLKSKTVIKMVRNVGYFLQEGESCV